MASLDFDQYLALHVPFLRVILFNGKDNGIAAEDISWKIAGSLVLDNMIIFLTVCGGEGQCYFIPKSPRIVHSVANICAWVTFSTLVAGPHVAAD